MIRILQIAAVMTVATGCGRSADVEHSLPQNRDPADAATISLREGRLEFNSKSIAVPAKPEEFEKLFGTADRTFDKANILYVWDTLGIVGYRKKDSSQVDSIDVSFKDQGYEFSPKSLFLGRVILPNGMITADSTAADLRAAGLSVDADLPFLYILDFDNYNVIAEYEQGVKSVALDWAPQ